MSKPLEELPDSEIEDPYLIAYPNRQKYKELREVLLRRSGVPVRFPHLHWTAVTKNETFIPRFTTEAKPLLHLESARFLEGSFRAVISDFGCGMYVIIATDQKLTMIYSLQARRNR
jgi:hypothetical protein